jgi:hypothetical protein
VLASFLVVKRSLGSDADLILYWLVASSWRQILRHGGCSTSSIDLDVSRLVVEFNVDLKAVRPAALTDLGRKLYFLPAS